MTNKVTVMADKKGATTATETFGRVLVMSTLGGVCAVRRDVRSLRRSWARGAWTAATLVAAVTHLAWIPRGIAHLVKENESLLNTTRQQADIDEQDQDFVVKLINPLSVACVGVLYRGWSLFVAPRRLSAVLARLEEADATLGVSVEDSRRDARRVTLACVGLAIISLPHQMTSNIGLSGSRTLVLALLLFNTFNNYAAACVELQFDVLCHLTTVRLRRLNARLKNIMLMVSGNAGRAYRETWRLHESYRRLCDILDAVGSMYGGLLLVSVADTNLNVLMNLYFALFGGFYKPEDKAANPQSWVDIANDMLWAAFYFVRFVGMAASAGAASDAAAETAAAVAEALARSPALPPPLVEQELGRMLRSCKNRRVQFWLLGLVTLDLPLVTSAVATACTYLIIMAQFNSEKIEKAKKKSATSNRTLT